MRQPNRISEKHNLVVPGAGYKWVTDNFAGCKPRVVLALRDQPEVHLRSVISAAEAQWFGHI
jgi:hypothetical protein